MVVQDAVVVNAVVIHAIDAHALIHVLVLAVHADSVDSVMAVMALSEDAVADATRVFHAVIRAVDAEWDMEDTDYGRNTSR